MGQLDTLHPNDGFWIDRAAAVLQGNFPAPHPPQQNRLAIRRWTILRSSWSSRISAGLKKSLFIAVSASFELAASASL